MAGPFESGSSEKKPWDGPDIFVYNWWSCCWILGFTSLKGFVFYFLFLVVTSLGLVAKARFSMHSYFDSSNRVLLDGFLGGLMSFVLFWTYPSLL